MGNLFFDVGNWNFFFGIYIIEIFNVNFIKNIQSDGKIVIGGSFTTYDGISRNYIARLNNDGTLDTSFAPGTGASAGISALALQSDGKIIIGGNFTTYNGTSINRIARINADGTIDSTFTVGTGASSYVYTLALQSDGKIIRLDGRSIDITTRQIHHPRRRKANFVSIRCSGRIGGHSSDIVSGAIS